MTERDSDRKTRGLCPAVSQSVMGGLSAPGSAGQQCGRCGCCCPQGLTRLGQSRVLIGVQRRRKPPPPSLRLSLAASQGPP